MSVRTFNRNFEGRSGTQDAQVYLASAADRRAQCALAGEFTDPATWGPAPGETRAPWPTTCPPSATSSSCPP